MNHRPFNTQSNGLTYQPQNHSDLPFQRAPPLDPTSDGRLLPPPNVLARKGSDISGGSSEPDSLLDLYGNNSARRSRNDNSDFADRGAISGSHYNDEDSDNSRWIHRDKLARIESEELQRAGIIIGGRESRSASRHASGRPQNSDRLKSQTVEQDRQSPYDTQGRLNHLEAGRAAEQIEENDPDGVQSTSFDLRLPEEAASDPADFRYNSSPQMRGGWPSSHGSSSRIPLPKSSPIPIPQDYIERHAPLPRRNSGDEHSITYSKSRSRSQSLGSQILLDDDDHCGTYAPPSSSSRKVTPQTSPTKAKTPLTGTPGSSGRKSSVSRGASSQQKPPLRSVVHRDSPSQRPVTRSGDVKRPEGDPPWMATMYKPDPRLPPDQQLLPTVAKRLQQEQWEREGKFGNVYDKEFNPMNIDAREQPPAPAHEQFQEPEVKTDPRPQALEVPDLKGPGGEWPLAVPRSPSSTGRPETSGTEHGGYKTMPTLQQAHSHGRANASTPIQSLHVEETDPTTKKRGCGCCVVM
ncbi:MAG: hypothetical protein M1817_004888 [Caeruleum heppii]|nr:MAG: hypothetical protein M1817_004888 [Caeruleum heppii]